MTRDHDVLRDLLAPVALGAAHPREVAQVEAHAEQCPICAEDLAAYREGVHVLSRSVPQVEPPPALRESVMEAVRAELRVRETVASASERPRPRPRRRWLPALRPWPVATAVVLAGALAVAGWNLALQTREPVAANEVTALSVRGEAGIVGRVLYVPDEDTAVVRLSRLRPAGDGRGYEVWVLRDGAEPESAGFLEAAGPSEGVKVVSDLRDADGLAVTVERFSNLRRPTSEPLVSVPLGGSA